jgi:hypothetical protein
MLSPGIRVLADTGRITGEFDYSPVITMYARTTSQNSLSHQFNGTGQITLVPETAFIDLRATAGVQPLLGGFGGGGGIASLQAGGLTNSLINAATLNRANQVQTGTFSITPYITRDLGDYGTLRIGGSARYSRRSQLSGFTFIPFSETGANDQSEVATEQNIRYTSGEYLGRFQSTVEGLMSQTPISTGSGIFGAGGLGSIHSSGTIRIFVCETVKVSSSSGS